MTGKADWRLIQVGEAKTTVKGFFGQPLAGLTPGLGSAGGDGFAGDWCGSAAGTGSAVGLGECVSPGSVDWGVFAGNGWVGVRSCRRWVGEFEWASRLGGGTGASGTPTWD